uniref:Pollen Ole e 1 allergen and extensin family protein n=1 Tax=Brassica campestris TaxID=3711 RepID=M4E7K7_BRACM
MAKSNAYLISILIIISSLSSPSQGLTIAGYTINQVIIDDVVYCRFNGTPNPVSNATVYLTCGGSTTRLVEVLTDTYGAFRIVLNVLQTVLLSSSTCGLGVNVPEGYCALVAPENVLYAPLMLLNIVRNGTITPAYYTANLIFG